MARLRTKPRVCLIRRNDSSDPRCAKISSSLMKAGYEVIYVGWNSVPDRPQAFVMQSDQLLVLTHKAEKGMRGILYFFPFLIHLFVALIRLRPDVVHCVNEETVLMVLPFKGVLYRRIVCDLFDSMSDRIISSHKSITLLAYILSRIALIGSDRIVVTDERRLERLGRFSRKALIIANVPVDPGASYSLHYPSGRPKVFVSGCLAKSRGLDIILAAAERVPEAELVVAGHCDDDYASEVFIHSPRVNYYGRLTPEESLHVAAQCDAVLAYYEPRNVNNIYASPNKIYDAMSVGRPVIINSETQISEWICGNHLGTAAPYYDIEALAKILAGLSSYRPDLPTFADSARKLYEKQFTWDIMEKRLNSMYYDMRMV
jgi:glycosyltransferase involved in cell wall biosynthesis